MKVVIGCPKGVRTGGPEALHQLAFELRRNSVEAYLHDFSLIGRYRPAVPEYEIYRPSWIKSLPRDCHLVIANENFPYVSRRIFRDEKVSKSIWWLSVDNADFVLAKSFNRGSKSLETKGWMHSHKKGPDKTIIRLVKFAQGLEKRYLLSKVDPMKSIHLAQSAYAEDFVREAFGLPSYKVSDYIRRTQRSAIDPKVPARVNLKPQVAFNPAKGGGFVAQLASLLPDIEFLAIRNMTAEEVRDLLSSSDLYLDMGHFPGKDRLPREAVIQSCPVMLAGRGSARYFEDFPLPEEFLIDMEEKSPQEVSEQIRKVLASGRQKNFSRQADFFAACNADRRTFELEVAKFVSSLRERS